MCAIEARTAQSAPGGPQWDINPHPHPHSYPQPHSFTSSSLTPQDLDGFGLEESIHEVEDAPTDKDPDNFGMPEDGYDYGKHLRSIGDGTFISREQARSEASAARSGVTGLSRISRASLASKQGEILLRGVADGAFASAEELSVAVGDAVGGEVSTEDQNLAAIAEMDEDMKAALFDDETLEDLEEPDDDFVIKAGEFRETELISCPARMPKRGVYAVPEEVDEGQEGELRVDADGVAYPIASYKEVCFSLTLFSHPPVLPNMAHPTVSLICHRRCFV